MFNDLPDIRNVKGLDEAELALINQLQRTWWRKRARNTLRNRYYDAHNRLKDLGISIPPALKNIDTYIGWPAKAVDYLAERAVLEGFTFNGVDKNETLDAVMDENDFLSVYAQAESDALVSSFSLLSVTKGLPGEPAALVCAHSARDSAVLWDFRKKRIESALVVADFRRDASGAIVGASLMNLFTSDEVITVARANNNRWVLANRASHSQGQPLVEAIRYSPKLGRPLGRSRVSRTVMSLTDSAVREALRSEVSAEFFTAPQKYILGADDDVFEDKPQWESYIGCYMAISLNEEGEKPSVGQFPQGTMQPHADYERQLAAKFACETCVPISSLGVIHDNPSSAEAIYAAKEDIIIKAQNFNRYNRSALRRVGRLMLSTAEDVPVADLPKDALSVEPRFMNPAIPSIASQTDAMIKQVSAVPEFGNTRVFWEQLGYDDAQISRIQSDIRRSRAQGALSAAFAENRKSERFNDGEEGGIGDEGDGAPAEGV